MTYVSTMPLCSGQLQSPAPFSSKQDCSRTFPLISVSAVRMQDVLPSSGGRGSSAAPKWGALFQLEAAALVSAKTQRQAGCTRASAESDLMCNASAAVCCPGVGWTHGMSQLGDRTTSSRLCTCLLSVCLSVHCLLSCCYVLHSPDVKGFLEVTFSPSLVSATPRVCRLRACWSFPTCLCLSSCTAVWLGPSQELTSRAQAAIVALVCRLEATDRRHGCRHRHCPAWHPGWERRWGRPGQGRGTLGGPGEPLQGRPPGGPSARHRR